MRLGAAAAAAADGTHSDHGDPQEAIVMRLYAHLLSSPCHHENRQERLQYWLQQQPPQAASRADGNGGDDDDVDEMHHHHHHTRHRPPPDGGEGEDAVQTKTAAGKGRAAHRQQQQHGEKAEDHGETEEALEKAGSDGALPSSTPSHAPGTALEQLEKRKGKRGRRKLNIVGGVEPALRTAVYRFETEPYEARVRARVEADKQAAGGGAVVEESAVHLGAPVTARPFTQLPYGQRCLLVWEAQSLLQQHARLRATVAARRARLQQQQPTIVTRRQKQLQESALAQGKASAPAATTGTAPLHLVLPSAVDLVSLLETTSSSSSSASSSSSPATAPRSPGRSAGEGGAGAMAMDAPPPLPAPAVDTPARSAAARIAIKKEDADEEEMETHKCKVDLRGDALPSKDTNVWRRSYLDYWSSLRH
ncbi:hypothetical protein STCU_11169 [Strigomonas culicis]|uniref:Uncharacterized protein n=1 Tax=Strigomonas culicis TaxID=28005 RepID=S9TEQ5_9TRYP|nr:hypothetical protein STCU_11169 [Strigomonas culicis]|eukprot:EPY16527.1 hypothetical protein STCU_11169 [Strigomonas culicis]